MADTEGLGSGETCFCGIANGIVKHVLGAFPVVGDAAVAFYFGK